MEQEFSVLSVTIETDTVAGNVADSGNGGGGGNSGSSSNGGGGGGCHFTEPE